LFPVPYWYKMVLQEFTFMMTLLQRTVQLWRDKRGQDMVEYALLAASVAVVVAGFIPPAVAPAISTIFSKVISLLNYNAS
jgi:Flp pilus assembly pilin Flp